MRVAPTVLDLTWLSLGLAPRSASYCDRPNVRGSFLPSSKYEARCLSMSIPEHDYLSSGTESQEKYPGDILMRIICIWLYGINLA